VYVAASERNDARVAVVTGSTGGIGAGIARRLAADGFAVMISGRREAQGEAIVREIAAQGGRAWFHAADMGDPEACRGLVDATVERFRRLDVVVNNAGIFPIIEIEDTTAKIWDEIFAVNVRAPFLCAQAAIAHLKKQGGGVIVNIGSTTMHRALGDRIAYATSKGALLTLTKRLAATLLKDKIRVNWVTVGWVATEGELALRSQHVEGVSAEAYLEKIGADAPLGRLETVEDIAAGVSYLVSDAASHVTGCELNISGGLWI
jgi:NAD(P)-dependent dehydrogenase (short-subunit alcohol dehydrogenase family)